MEWWFMESKYRNKNGAISSCVCGMRPQIIMSDFNALNDLAFNLENALLRRIEALERKQNTGDWVDHLVIEESNVAYCITPPLRYRTTPLPP